MIAIGLVLLAFVGYQLWGTGFFTARQQDQLQTEFEEQFEKYRPVIESQQTTTTTEATDTSSTIPTSTTQNPATTPTTVITAPIDLPFPSLGSAIARLTIPKISSDYFVVQGVDLEYLKSGPGHFPQTPLPGQPGNVAIAGHRTTYGAPFNRLDELNPGDLIYVKTLQGDFTYKVDSHFNFATGQPEGHYIVSPTEVSVLDPTIENRITLLACHPKFSAASRIVVTATLQGVPAPPTVQAPTEAVTDDASIDALADGDSSRWPWAIFWSLLSIGIGFAAWFAMKKKNVHGWAKVGVWVGVAVVLVVPIYMAFENIASLLPASY